MLRARIITGLALAFGALATIYLLPLQIYSLVFGLVGAIAAYEYAGLAGVENRFARVAYTLIFIVLAGLNELLLD